MHTTTKKPKFTSEVDYSDLSWIVTRHTDRASVVIGAFRSCATAEVFTEQYVRSAEVLNMYLSIGRVTEEQAFVIYIYRSEGSGGKVVTVDSVGD